MLIVSTRYKVKMLERKRGGKREKKSENKIKKLGEERQRS